MVKEKCDHYWKIVEGQDVEHLTEIKVQCRKCGAKGVAHFV